jgi:hypothetical protein
LGNDSALALSTGFVGIGTTSAVGGRMELAIGGNAGGSAIQLGRSGTNKATIQSDSSDNLYIETNGAFPMVFSTNGSERMRITSAGNVGIGTSSPFQPAANRTVASINGITSSVLNLGVNNSLVTYLFVGAGGSTFETAGSNTISASGANPIIFNTNAVERVRVTDNGLTFNGDTAAANALDDYEEGTWTPTMQGATFTYAGQLGYYTKIGRQVLVWLDIDASYSSPTGSFAINNLPFTQANGRGEGVVRPINGVVFTGYVTCEALGSLIYFSNNFTGVGSNTTDMDNTNFNAAGFRIFVSVSYTV